MKMPCRNFALGTVAAFALVAAAPAESLAQGRYGWHRHHGGSWAGPAVAAGILGALTLGAIAASAYPYGPAYARGCVWRRQPVYGAWGQFVGYQPVQVCY
jgi:hypothetical protein